MRVEKTVLRIPLVSIVLDVNFLLANESPVEMKREDFSTRIHRIRIRDWASLPY